MLWGYPPLLHLDMKIYDKLSQIRQRDMPSPVVIIEIDRKSIKQLGSWPWPRSYMADIISTISTAKAKAIGLDILYQSKELNPALKEIRSIKKNLNDSQYLGRDTEYVTNLLKEASRKIDQDSLLVSTLRPTRNVVLPVKLSWDEPADKDSGEIPGWFKRSTLEKNTSPLNPQDLIATLRNPLLAFKPVVQPTALYTSFHALAAVVNRHAHINYLPDPDGVVRQESLLIKFHDHLIPSFALQLSMPYDGQKLSDLHFISSYNITNALRYSGRKLPVSHDFRMFIDFDDNPFVISTFSFIDVLHGKIPKGILEDKLVLIGITDPELTMTYLTPLGTRRSGIEISAASIENIINNSTIQKPGWAWFLESIVLLYFGIILLSITSRLTPRISLLILGTFLLSWWGLAVFMFTNNGLWFYVAPHTITVVLGFSLQQFNLLIAAPGKKIDEHTEMNKMLGLSFQAQGLLDMAFDSFRKCSLNDEPVKEAIYNLALDFERKRMFNKAISAYEYLLKGGKFKDANDRIWRLRRAEAKSLGGNIGNRSENTVLFSQDTTTRPTLGRYEVLKEIGKGAIGTVYLGRDPKINRKVAIKTLRYDEIDSEQLADIKERFFREAEAAGRLSHPNIVTIYDAGEDYDITYMAMEYLDGHDLARHCRKDNMLPPKTILNIIIRVAFALDYAHKHKVIHRDIKPANIMLTEKGHVKVTDFGIARLTSADSTQTGVILGTPNYMSPEQVLGKKLDGRSDIFSLGAVFYELLTGEKPFKSNNIGNLMHNIASAKFQPIGELRPDVPPCCEALVRRMMSKSRAKRFSSAGEVVIEAQQCLENV